MDGGVSGDVGSRTKQVNRRPRSLSRTLLSLRRGMAIGGHAQRMLLLFSRRSGCSWSLPTGWTITRVKGEVEERAGEAHRSALAQERRGRVQRAGG